MSHTSLSARALFHLILVALLAPPAMATANEEASEDSQVRWNDTSRDVYLDGRLDPQTLVLAASEPDRLALVNEKLEGVVVVDLESSQVTAHPRDLFSFDGEGATTPPLKGYKNSGQLTKIRDGRSTHLSISSVGHQFHVAPHQGPQGPLTMEELWAVAPAWKRRTEMHEPDPQQVAELAAYDGEEVEISLALGTWCGDSRSQVPPFLKALEAAQNQRLKIQLLAIGRGFTTPADTVREIRLTNVPTMVVSRHGEEIGRTVETAITESLAADLAAILAGELPEHPGRYARRDLLAQGRYSFRNAEAKTLAEESWRLFDTDDDGRLLYSVLKRGGQRTEVWLSRRPDGTPSSVEVTRYHGEFLSRTRAWIDEEGNLRAHTRGNRSGIVDQELSFPPGAAFVLPNAVAAAFDSLRAESGKALAGFRLRGAGQPVAGERVELQVERAAAERRETPVGTFSAPRMTIAASDRKATWWVHPELGVPVEGAFEGIQVRLEELELGTE